mgnify:CR=1 FL=1
MKKITLAIIVLLLVANTAVWHAVYTENQRKELTVAFLDIGQGDAIFIEAPNGNQVIVDGGPNSKILHELGKLMPWYDKTIDMIIVTNPDKDHIAGFADILKRYKVSYLIESGTQNKSLIHNTVQELAREKGVEKVTARRGMEIFLDEESDNQVVLTVLFPDKDVSKEKPNDGSIVMRLKYGKTEVMLTGDAPISVEKHILSLAESGAGLIAELNNRRKFAQELTSDILKVGHHGSKTSTDAEFLAAVNPKFAVISSGKENKYGHPHEEVLATLAKFSQFPLKILRTDELGTIVMKSDGKNFVREE